MSDPAVFVESSADRGVRGRLPVVLSVLGLVAVLVVGYGAWVLTRPAPFEERAGEAAECVAVPPGSFVTHGTLTIRNRSDHPVEIISMRLEDARGILQTGVPMLVPVRSVPVGNEAGYPPKAVNAIADGINLGQGRPIVHGIVPPERTAGTMNLVVGMSLSGVPADASFSSLALKYKDGWRTRTWHSKTSLSVVTTRKKC